MSPITGVYCSVRVGTLQDEYITYYMNQNQNNPFSITKVASFLQVPETFCIVFQLYFCEHPSEDRQGGYREMLVLLLICILCISKVSILTKAAMTLHPSRRQKPFLNFLFLIYWNLTTLCIRLLHRQLYLV